MLKIGVAYDTPDMYNIEMKNLYYDFADTVSINRVLSSLKATNHTAHLIGNTQNVLKLISKNEFDYDLIYNTVEGFGSRNREGLLPAVLEAYNIPYIGTDSFGLSLTLNKTLMKIFAQSLNINTPNYFYINKNLKSNDVFNKLKKLNTPIIIKPNYEGNSSGIQLAHSMDEAYQIICETHQKYNSAVLCEEFIKGQEITVPIIGNDSNFHSVATTINIQNDDFWLDINCKVFGDYKNIILLDKILNRKLCEISEKLFLEIGCSDFARFDYRVDKNGVIFFIEANPLPALFEGGSFELLGKSMGLNFNQMINLIVETACKRLNISF